MQFMKACAMGLLVSSAVMSGAHAEGDKEDIYKCARVGKFAEMIMSTRQKGSPMSRVMRLTEKMPELKDMIISAYKEPRYLSEDAREREITEFRNRFELACYSEQG